MQMRTQTCIVRPKIRQQQAFHSRVPPTTLHSPKRGNLGKGGARLCASSTSCSPELHGLSYPIPSYHSPEERVVLNADLPQPLGGAVVRELEADGALKLFILRSQEKLVRGGTWATHQPTCSPSPQAGVTSACSCMETGWTEAFSMTGPVLDMGGINTEDSREWEVSKSLNSCLETLRTWVQVPRT